MRYSYEYITESRFQPAVEWHFLKLRACPCSNEFQQLVSSRLEVTASLGTPAGATWSCHMSCNQDGQGNDVQWGSICHEHDLLRVMSAGQVWQTQPYLLHQAPAPYYVLPTRLTSCTAPMLRLRMQGPAFAVALSVMHWVNEYITYTPFATTVSTTAADVWAHPQGVCQDYAHLMIALCRAAGLHARYVCGFIEGEGQTHAWVEVSDGHVWRAFDPTHNRAIDYGYIKVAHGRDANDCPMNRGRIYGHTFETMNVNCRLLSAARTNFLKSLV